MSKVESSTKSEITAGTTTSTAVLEAVSSASDTPAVDLPPLYDAVDPDALNSLFSAPGTSGEISFRYAGYTVTVSADRTVEVSATS